MIKARTRRIVQGADYSAQEPRVFTQLCEDPIMLKAYMDRKDLYVEIASISFHKPYKMCLEHFPKGAPIKERNGHWYYALLKGNGGQEDDIETFEDLKRYLEPDFDPELYDYDKLADGENDVYDDGKELRRQAKQILLGILYSRGEKSIAEQLGCDLDEAHEIKSSVYDAFEMIKPFEDKSNKMVREKGYVTTLWGRRRHLEDFNLPTIEAYYVYYDNGKEVRRDNLQKTNPSKYTQILTDLLSKRGKQKTDYINDLKTKDSIIIVDNGSTIAKAGRQIINSQVQGSAADMSKLALIKIFYDEELNKRGVKIIIPVHDEILIETPLRYGKVVKPRFEKDMENAARPVLTIPISCDVESSFRWYGEQINFDEELAGLPELEAIK